MGQDRNGGPPQAPEMGPLTVIIVLIVLLLLIAVAVGGAYFYVTRLGRIPVGHVGVVHRHIEVISQDGQFRADLDLRAWKRGGTIKLGGTSYNIRATGAVSERWRCERDGQELFGVKEIHSLGKGKGAIEITDLGRSDPNIALLLLLTIHANHAADSEGAAAGAAAGA